MQFWPIFDKSQISKRDKIYLGWNGENLLMRCERVTLKLPEKNENVDGTAYAELLALKEQKFDQNRPLCIGTIEIVKSLFLNDFKNKNSY